MNSRIIALTGFMGSGKTSVGRVLAERLGLAFADLDDLVEKAAGKSVPEVFSEDGEAAFRSLELQTLSNLFTAGNSPLAAENLGRCCCEGNPAAAGLVLALGGGTIMQAQARALLKGRATLIYLKTGADTLVSRLKGTEAAGRPLLAGGDIRTRIASLLQEREPVYEVSSDLIVDTDGLTPEEIASHIATQLQSR